MNSLTKTILKIIGTFILTTALSMTAAAVAFSSGDVFAGTGGGKIDVYSSSGTFIQTLDTTSGSSEQTGMCFDISGNLYATSFTDLTMSKFSNTGALLVYPWGGPFGIHPESCVVDASGNIYTGEVDGSEMIRKFDPGGSLLGQWSPATERRGIDWIDLAADQKTMFYTSEGSLVKRFDVSTGTQLTDFATGLSSPCYALRIRTNGEVMVACRNLVYRLDTTGSVIQTYPKSGFVTPSGTTGESDSLFAMNLDPDGTSFWTGGYSTGHIYKIDIATGTQLTTFTAPPRVYSMAGLTVYGEITVGGGNQNHNEIPEFPTVALPVISILGLMFLFSRRKNT